MDLDTRFRMALPVETLINDNHCCVFCHIFIEGTTGLMYTNALSHYRDEHHATFSP